MRLASVLTVALAALPGCGSDDTPAIDATTADGPPGPDAPPACELPTTVIPCTLGNHAPCTAVCGAAYCHNFNQLGTVCTEPCRVVGDCPSGWSCNNMGRCRPPG